MMRMSKAALEVNFILEQSVVDVHTTVHGKWAREVIRVGKGSFAAVRNRKIIYTKNGNE